MGINTGNAFLFFAHLFGFVCVVLHFALRAKYKKAPPEERDKMLMRQLMLAFKIGWIWGGLGLIWLVIHILRASSA